MKPYRIYKTEMPFAKNGMPITGSFGRDWRSVVVLDAETMKRMLNEHPTLRAAEFEIVEYATAQT